MDSQENEEFNTNPTPTKKKGLHVFVFRYLFVLLFPVFAFLLLSFLIGFVALLFGNSYFTTPISVPSQCKIVSSSVDLRSSKVCELGLLNYKAKHVFYPSESKKFRCRYDYYWASVFQVEYKDHLSGQSQLALAEAPNEALPLDCRPNFGYAWLIKDKFKVNESYDCWYTYGFSKVNIYQDDFFSCQAKDPSVVEMIRRYNILFTSILQSWFSTKSSRWETLVEIITGFATPFLSISLVRILHQFKNYFPKIYANRIFPLVVSKRAFFLVAYLSFMGWLAIQYGKKVGLLDHNTIR